MSSCCGGNCGCGPNCKCDNGCAGCKMYPNLGEAYATMIQGVEPQKGYLGEFEMAAGSENGGCKCNPCTCNPSNCK